MTEKVIATQRQKFLVEAGRNTAVNFHSKCPTAMICLVFVWLPMEVRLRWRAASLPVLSNKEYITETLAMPIRGEETRTFSLDSLFNP